MSSSDLLYELTPPLLWKWMRNRPHKEDTNGIPADCGVTHVFVHIHKCAGTSMRKTLVGQPGFLCCATRPGRFEDRLSRDYISDTTWQNSFKFTFVRNPHARVVSAFKMFHRSPRWRELFPDFPRFIDFLRWCDVDGHCIHRETPMQQFVHSLDNILHHCSSYHNPKYMLDQLDYVGKVETLEHDLRQISERTGTTLPPIPRLNATKKDDYQKYYDSRTSQIVTDKYRRDIERFEYNQ